MQRWIPCLMAGFLLFSVVFLGMAQGAGSGPRAPVITVCPAGCDYTHIQDAVNAAMEGDTIQVFAGTYTETVAISQTVTIQGEGMDNTVVNAAGLGRGVSIRGQVAVTLTGMTIENGLAPAEADNDAHGGGIYNEGHLLLLRTRIRENQAVAGDAQLPDMRSGHAYGGGLFNGCGEGYCGQAILEDSIIFGNKAAAGIGLDGADDDQLAAGGNAHGGGIFNDCSGSICANLIVTVTIIMSNSVEGGKGFAETGSFTPGGQAKGGGLYNEGPAILSNSIITGNLAFGGDENNYAGTTGGGVFNSPGGYITGFNITIANNELHGGDSHFFYNQSVGGGVYNDGFVSLNSSLISGNEANSGQFYKFVDERAISRGGGIFNGGNLFLNGTVITNNVALDGYRYIALIRYPVPAMGGGIQNWGTMTISTSHLSNNTAGEGAGIYHTGPYGEIISSTISNNTGLYCAGINNFGLISINYSAITKNKAYGHHDVDGGEAYGGGLCNHDRMHISGSDISYNRVTSGGGASSYKYGGGIVNRGYLEISASAIHHNSASAFAYAYAEAFGGGIYHYHTAGGLAITNTTISQNALWVSTQWDTTQGKASGSGIYVAVSGARNPLTLRNVTISGNDMWAEGDGPVALIGGGIVNAVTSAVDFTNSIIAQNTHGDCAGNIISSGHNLAGDNTCLFHSPGDMVNTNPFLSMLLDHGGPTLTHSLLWFSPAVDAGDNVLCPDTDQRGFPRPVDGNDDGISTCDIGAVEVAPPTDFLFLPMAYYLP